MDWESVLERTGSYLELRIGRIRAGGSAARVSRLDRMTSNSLRAKNAIAAALSAICSKINSKGEFTGVIEKTRPGIRALPAIFTPAGNGAFRHWRMT